MNVARGAAAGLPSRSRLGRQEARLLDLLPGVRRGQLAPGEVPASRTGSPGLEPFFPLWHEPTGPLARRMVDAGLEAVVTCANPRKFPVSFAGRRCDHALLDDLPEGVDPCGEHGEFHTCGLAGPTFRERVCAAVGEVVERDGFYFADLVPAPAAAGAREPAGRGGHGAPWRAAARTGRDRDSA